MLYKIKHEDLLLNGSMVKRWLGNMTRISLFLLIFITSFSFESEATHYRYGNITWARQSSTSKTVTFTITQAWRRSFPLWPGAVTGQIINTQSSLLFGDGGSAPILLTITSVNAADDWVYGTFTTTHTYATFTNFTASYSGAARLQANASPFPPIQNNSAGNFSSQTTLHLGDAANLSSPVSSLPPIINMATGNSSAQFTIPAFDPDGGGPVTFVLSTQAEAGGGGSFVQPAGISVNSVTGVVSFSTAGKPIGHLYNAAVTITDAAGSKTMVDFLIRIVGVSTAPAFDYSVGFTPVDGQLFSINPGQNINFNVKADDIDPLDIVELSAVGLASGMVFSPSLPITGVVDMPVTTNFNWTPTTGQLGAYILTFTAEDLVGTQTNTTVTINVNTNPIFISPTPASGPVRYVETGTSITDIIVATNPDPTVNTQLFSAITPAASTLSNPLPTGFLANPTTTLSWTPLPANWGSHAISFTAKDVNNRTTTHVYDLFVNTMPVFTSTPVTTAIVNQLYTYNVVATDADVPFGDELEVELFGTILPPWLTYTSNGDGTGTLTGTPALTHLGNYNVGFIAEDDIHHGHPDVLQLFNINVVGVPPTVTCPSNVIVSASTTSCDAVVNYDPATATGIPTPTVTYSTASGSLFTVGSHTILVTAANGVGSNAQCSFTVTVVDDTYPQMICPSDIYLNACTSTASWSAPGATDNCGVSVIQTGGPASGSPFANGTTTPITYTATDPSGNAVSCTFNVIRAAEMTATCAVNNPQLYYGFSGDQTATITVTPGSGVGPYTVSITMNRALKCNVSTLAGDELWVGGSNTNTSLNVNTVCPGLGGGGIPVSTSNSFSSGSYSINVTLMEDAVITATVTDANGCISTCSKTIAAEDVRCFSGNSGNAKVAICHRTGSNNNPCTSICVNESSLESHLAHGDFLGKCTPGCVAPVVYTGRSQSAAAEVEGLNVKVMPNPSSQYFNLGIESISSDNVQIKVFNINGRQVYVASGGTDRTYRFGDTFIPGMYLVEITQGEMRSTIKVIRQ